MRKNICGPNLVVELPFPFCMLSARDFASAGVYIAAMLGADSLAFGCEDDFSLLSSIAEKTGSGVFEKSVVELIKSNKNLSYPKAKKAAVEQIFGEKAAVIKKPNNILALEYLSAIKNGGYEIKPHPIKRNQSFLSSSAIRKSVDLDEFLSFLPERSAAVYGAVGEGELPRLTEKMSQYIIATLRMFKVKSSGSDMDIYGTPPDLFNSIMSTSLSVSSFSELVQKCQNNIYTEARVRRSVLSAVFGVTASDALCKPNYALLLTADSTGCDFLRNRKDKIALPVITKPSHINRQPAAVARAFMRECCIDNVISLFTPGERADKPFCKTPFILQ